MAEEYSMACTRCRSAIDIHPSFRREGEEWVVDGMEEGCWWYCVMAEVPRTTRRREDECRWRISEAYVTPVVVVVEPLLEVVVALNASRRNATANLPVTKIFTCTVATPRVACTYCVLVGDEEEEEKEEEGGSGTDIIASSYVRGFRVM